MVNTNIHGRLKMTSLLCWWCSRCSAGQQSPFHGQKQINMEWQWWHMQMAEGNMIH